MTKYLPELQRRLLMRKLKLMDSHGVPNLYDEKNADAIEEEREHEGKYSPFDEDESDEDKKEREAREGGGGVAEDEEVYLQVGSAPAAGPWSGEDVAVRGGVIHHPRPGGGMGNRSSSYNDVRFQAKLSPLGLSVDTGDGAKNDNLAGMASPPTAKDGKGGHGGRNSGGGGGNDTSLRGHLKDRRNEVNRQEDLPFELIALEVALEIVCNQLEAEQRDIGNEARPALEGLRKKVSTANLERVRRIKSRVTRITGRVSKVREEVQRYLDDDSDMRDMYLTRKLLAEMFVNMEPTPGGGLHRGNSGNFGNFYSPRFSMSHLHGDRKRRASGNEGLMRERQRSFEKATLDAALSSAGKGDPLIQGQGQDNTPDQGQDMYDDEEQHEYFDPKDDDKVGRGEGGEESRA